MCIEQVGGWVVGGVVGQVVFVGQMFVDVFGQDQVCLVFVEVQLCQVGVDFEYGVVFVLVYVYCGVLYIVDVCLCDGVMDFILVFVWVDVENVYGQEFVMVEFVLVDCGFVYFQEVQCIGVEYLEWCWIVVEQQVELVFGLLYLCQCLYVFVDIGECVDYVLLLIYYCYLLVVCGYLVDGFVRQYYVEYFIQYCCIGEGGVEGGLYVWCVVVVYVCEEIGNWQVVDFYVEDFVC